MTQLAIFLLVTKTVINFVALAVFALFFLMLFTEKGWFAFFWFLEKVSGKKSPKK
jgi:hypothetical protein